MPVQLVANQETVAGYTLIERIGAGGYGEVWKVDAPGGLFKAMKFVFGRFDDVRASRELKALNRIKEVRHPFLVSLERIEVVDSQLIIVTELADMSLKDRFDQCRAEGLDGIPRQELLGYLRDAADALDFMREQHGLQHLDIKPENLLVVGGHVKVADFGLVKGLHDASVSMIGGLTPIYASPEVFDDKASEFSDQYSLAIVYQELLTGALPFPGRTPAQLAAQHLGSRPLLSALERGDQTVVARALAKKPINRYPTCGEMIGELLNPPAAPGSEIAPETHQAGPESRHGRPPSPGRGAGSQSPGDHSPVAAKTEAIRRSSDVRRATDSGSRPAQDRSVVDLDAVPLDDLVANVQPTVFIGIGGTGGLVLARLRRRIERRFGTLAAVPAIRMMTIDTDAKAIDALALGEHGSKWSDAECAAMPIRRSQEYRENSKKFLRWLSRRWLFNIPKSHQTEGIRPLGRLAFVDHAQAVFPKIRSAIEAATEPDALQATSETTGFQPDGGQPRVVVVTSISGGTGSGIALDVGFAVRALLGEMGLSDGVVCGVLAHSTAADAKSQELGAANAISFLAELRHFDDREQCYPGEDACGIPAADDYERAFDQTYLVSMGDGISERQYRDATDEVAEYLYLDVATPAGCFFDACRNNASQSVSFGTELRSFGIRRVSCRLDEAEQRGLGLIAGDLLRRWCGGSGHHAADAPPSGEPMGHKEIEQRAEKFAQSLGLAADQLVEQLLVFCEQELEDDLESFARRLALQHGQPSAETGAVKGPNDDVFAAIDELLGSRKQTERLRARRSHLELILANYAGGLSAKLVDSIRVWLFQLADNPRASFQATLHAASWFQDTVHNIAAEAQENLFAARKILTQFEREATGPKAKDQNKKPAKSWLNFGRRAASDEATQAPLADYVEIRFRTSALELVIQTYERIRSELASTSDEIAKARRYLVGLQSEFDVNQKRLGRDDRAESLEPLDRFSTLVQGALADSLDELIDELDAKLRASWSERHGGFSRALVEKPDLLKQLPEWIREQAAVGIHRRLAAIDVAARYFDVFTTEAQAADGIQSAVNDSQPQLLTDVGGARRVLATIPACDSADQLRALVHDQVTPTPSVLIEAERDIVVCQESEQSSLDEIIRLLADERPHCAKLAERVHTRIDVTWSPVEGS